MTHAKAQSRMTDQDVQNMLKNINQDAKSFRSSFDSAIKKSTIRKTTQEKDARLLVKQFQDQTQGMVHEFQQTKKLVNSLPVALASSKKISDLMSSVSLGDQVTSQWARVKTELDTITDEFHMVPAPQ